MVVAPTGETNGRHAQRHGSVDWRRPASLHGLQGSNPARGWNQVSVVPTRAIRNRRRLRRKRPLEPPRVRQPPMVERATPSEALASRCASPKQLRALCARLVRQSGGRRPAGAGTAAKSPQRSATSRSLSSAPVQPETPKRKSTAAPAPESRSRGLRAAAKTHGPERVAERAMERPAGGATCEGGCRPERRRRGEHAACKCVGRERESCLSLMMDEERAVVPKSLG